MEKRGLFIAFEGIDGSGKTSQIGRLERAICYANKYQDILRTREPTWRAEEIKKSLTGDANAFSGGEKLAYSFVQDRKIHTYKQIIPDLEQRAVVLCDRYALSTCAYQSAQKVPLDSLLAMHENAGTITPDLTLFLDISKKTGKGRKLKRGEKLEKFEKDEEFIDCLIDTYRNLARLSIKYERLRKVVGRIYTINGEQEIGEVAKEIGKIVLPVYHAWLASSYA